MSGGLLAAQPGHAQQQRHSGRATVANCSTLAECLTLAESHDQWLAGQEFNLLSTVAPLLVPAEHDRSASGFIYVVQYQFSRPKVAWAIAAAALSHMLALHHVAW
jgi:hypothetical protein